MCLFAALLSLVVVGCRSPAPEPEEPFRKAHPPDVARSVSPTRSFDHRPYEFIWDPRSPSHIPLVDFDLLIGWTVSGDEGVEATFERTQEEQLWGGYTGRLHYRAPGPGAASLEVRPPEPLRLPGYFDCAELWVYGPGTGCGPDPERAGPRLTLLLSDVEGRPFRIPMGALTWGGWEIVHRRIAEAAPDPDRHPFSFEGFLLEALPGGADEVVFIDALSFYVEQLHPLNPDPRPAPNLDLWPGIEPGLHQTQPPLPVPVDGRTVLPPGPGDRARTRVEEAGRHTYLFISETDDSTLRYRVDLTSSAPAIECSWNGVDVCRIEGGGRVIGEDAIRGRLLLARLEGGRVRAEFEGGAVYRFGLMGRSLVVDVYARGKDVDGFSLGRYAGPLRYTALAVPGLDIGRDAWARVGVLTGGGEAGTPPLFVSSVLDWYRSEASGIDSPAAAGPRTVYHPTTAGERNDLYERAVLTLAPRIEDVLPGLAQPAGARVHDLAARVWADADGPRDYAAVLQGTRRLAAYGLRDILQAHRATCWRDGNESCTLRTRAAPARGGDDALASLVAGQQALGWRVGLPASYYGIHGLSPFWSPDLVQREPSGEWRRGPTGHYGVKASSALGLQQRVGAAVAGKFAPSMANVCDVAASPPWAHTDFDARLPGAGRFSQVYYSAAELLLAEGETFDAPVVSPGGGETFYAGLLDGYLASAHKRRPYLPVFYLSRINPLACGFGVGPSAATEAGGESADAVVDAALADQIAYGRAARLASHESGIERQCRSYYMMRELQSRYLLREPLRIAYWDGEGMVSTSEAIVGGALARSQVYLLYPDNLEIWVNGSDDMNWDVRVGRDTWLLPPSGWVAAAPGFLEVSVLVDGGRVDYVDSTGFTYYDGRGQTGPFRGWASGGPLAAWSHADAEPPMLEVLDIQGTGRFGLPHQGTGPSRVEVYDLDRRPSGAAEVSATNGRVHVRGPAGPHLYRFLFAEEQDEDLPGLDGVFVPGIEETP